MDKEELKKNLKHWDGKKIAFLQHLYSDAQNKGSFVKAVLEVYSTDLDLSRPTSWLLKHHLDAGAALNTSQVDVIVHQLALLNDWESQLHVLQIVAKTGLTQKQAEDSEPIIQKLLTSNVKFVKAAAFEAYFEVVKVIPELQQAFRCTCEKTLLDASASVAVKIRRLLKKLPSAKKR